MTLLVDRGPAGTRERRSRGGFWPMRDLPALLWLVAVPVIAVAHPWVPAPRWLMIHLLLLGAATHSILVWSRHFADALLHTPPRPNDRRLQSARLVLLNSGVLLVLLGVPADLVPVTVAGAAAVIGAVGWHGGTLLAQLRRALPARFGVTVRYYVTAAALLPIGAVLGVLMARGLADPWHARVMLAHEAVNLLGWLGLTVLGTLVTLWPTMLRTRIADGAEVAARRALPVLLAAVSVAAVGASAGLLPVVALGLVGYLAGVGVLARPFVAVAWRKPPMSFPTWSVLAGLLWLVGSLVALVIGLGTATSWDEAHARVDWVAPALAAGFAAQVLLGALSFLVPMVLGGGPSPVRAANAVLDRAGALRIVLVNAGLVVSLLPVPSTVRVLSSLLVLGGLAAFIPLLLIGMRASRRAKAGGVGPLPIGPADGPPGRPLRGTVTVQAAFGLVLVVLAVAGGVALDPTALGGGQQPASAGVAPTGHTTRVVVRAADMRFTPATVRVPAGDRLVIELRNTDRSDVHDLVLDSGADSGRLSPGGSATMKVGVVGRDLEGWCSVVGHRQMGMVLHVDALGVRAAHAAEHRRQVMSAPAGIQRRGAAADLDFMADPGPGFVARDATLPRVEDGRVHRRTFSVQEVTRAVAPGVTQRLWTYDGTAPGPVLHGRVGDTFEITLVNDASIGHSVDFHAGALAPQQPMRTIAPGQSLVYRFTATKAGIWMYHCSTMPMSVHIAAGLFGAVVIDPPGLPPVDRSYLLLQSELYLGKQGGPVDPAKVAAERPDAVVFNGYANQYDHAPLRARVGERVRIWVLDAGPSRPTSFHVVGGLFDTVYAEGAYRLRPGSGGSQTLSLGPAQGGFVELAFPEPGRYPFVSHVMVDAERGAHGLVEVTD